MLLKYLPQQLSKKYDLYSICHKKSFYHWINSIFNKVDTARIAEVGADRAAAEWLIRCGASVKWSNRDKWVSDYNVLQTQDSRQNVIEEIDATGSCIMHDGFRYLAGLKHLKRIKLCKCYYIQDRCLGALTITKDTLQHLEVISCGNVTDQGIAYLSELKKLKTLYLFDLPAVKNSEECIGLLQKELPDCEVKFPPVQDK